MTKVWSIQPMRAIDELDLFGYYTTDPESAWSHANEFPYPAAYNWMCRQMAEKIGPSPTPFSEEGLPVWAWHRWAGTNQPKPIPDGDRLFGDGVIIEMEVPEDQILLSDFELWHYVLNYWYLEIGDGDEPVPDDYYNNKPVENQRHHQIINDSWQRIFDLTIEEHAVALSLDHKAVQGTMWWIKDEWVVNIEEYHIHFSHESPYSFNTRKPLVGLPTKDALVVATDEKCYMAYANDCCLHHDRRVDCVTMDGGFYFQAHRECVIRANELLEGASVSDPMPNKKPAHLAETVDEWANGGMPYWNSEKEMDTWIKIHFNEDGDWII